MRLILRLALTFVLVAVAAFCCFGFMASAEGDANDMLAALANPFRWFYGIVFAGCIAAFVAVWGVKVPTRLALTLVLIAIAAFCGIGFMSSYIGSADFLRFRWLYAAAFIACVAAIVWVVKAPRRQATPSRPPEIETEPVHRSP
jgi:hypothetical protein